MEAGLWLRNVEMVLRKPNAFFKKMKKRGGYRDPFSFALTNLSVGALMSSFFMFIGLQGPYYGIFQIGSLTGALVNTAYVLSVGVIGIFLNAWLAQMGMKIVNGKGKYEGTFRVFSYTTAIALISWIGLLTLRAPYSTGVALFSTLVTVYSIYISVVGLSHVHKTSVWRALGGFLLGMLIFFGILALVSVVVALAAVSFTLPAAA